MKLDVQGRLGERVRYLRQLRDFTQEQLAERSDFTVKYISHVERGIVNVPLVTLAIIAKALDVSPPTSEGTGSTGITETQGPTR